MTVGEDAIMGVDLTNSADDGHMREACDQVAAEAENLAPRYAPKTVNTDGWAATRNAFKSLFPGIAVILCFLHGFLKIRDRSRQDPELHRRGWDVYRAATADEFRRLMGQFQEWCGTRTWKTAVGAMLAKLGKRTEDCVVAYDHPGCRWASNMVDRPMNRLFRQMYSGRGLHGQQRSSEMRLKGWALLLNFRFYAPRSNQRRDFASPAHRL